MSTQTATKTTPLGPLRLYACSILIGVVAACGAVVFRGLIAFFHNLLFLGFVSCAAHNALFLAGVSPAAGIGCLPA